MIIKTYKHVVQITTKQVFKEKWISCFDTLQVSTAYIKKTYSIEIRFNQSK